MDILLDIKTYRTSRYSLPCNLWADINVLEQHVTPIFRVETYRVRKWLSNTEQVVTKAVTQAHGGGRKMEPCLGQQEMLGTKNNSFQDEYFFFQKEI